MKSLAKIIIIFPYRLRKFDYDRFEIECLQGHSDLIAHELIDVLHEKFTSAYHTQDNAKYIKRFSSLLAWRRDYLGEVYSCKTKPYVINFVPKSTFKELFVNIVLSNSSVYLIKYNNPGIPNHNNTVGFVSKLRTKWKFILRRGTLKWIIFSIKSIFTRYLSKLICRKNDYTLSVVNTNTNKKNTVSINSFDYSMFLRKRNSEKYSSKANDRIVYLDTGAPLFRTDSLLSGNRHPLSIELWYPSLTSFFDVLEKKTSKSVVIAAHPKHQYTKETSNYFGNRQIIHGQTPELVAHSSLVLVTNSTAVSYAVMGDIPILVLLSDELIADNNILLNESRHLSTILGCPSINISQFNIDFLNIFSIDKKKYQSYKAQYLSSRLDGKTNCEIIIDEIVNCK
jgi:hypothetical protein